MSEARAVTRGTSWWHRNRRWVVATALVPLSYVVSVVAGGWLTALGNRSGNVGWSLLGLVLLLVALAAPVVLAIIAIRAGYRAFRSWRRGNGHFTKREAAVRQVEDAYAAGWEHATWLRGALERQELPPEIAVWGVVPRPGERFFLSGPLGYARYYGTDVVYGQTSMVAVGRPAWVAGAMVGNAIGNSVARSRARAAAATQWREQQQVDALVSNQRVVCNVAERGWLSFDFAAVTAIYPAPEEYTVVLEFDGTSPVSFNGPMAPALGALAVMLTHGHDALRTHPALEPLRR